MKKAILRRILPVFLACFFLIPVPSHGEVADPLAFLTNQAEPSVTMTVFSPEILSLAWFDEKRTEQANRLLKHLSLKISLDGDLSSAAFYVDGTELFSILTEEDGKQQGSIYSFSPGFLYIRDSVPAETSDGFAGFLQDTFFPVNHLADSFYPFFEKMPETYAEYGREEKTDLNISGFGRASRRVTFSFPADFLQDHIPAVADSLFSTDPERQFLRRLVFSGILKVLLLYDHDGHLIRVTVNGKTGLSADSIRNVSLTWKCLRTDEQTRDQLSLKTPAVSGYDKYNMTYSRNLNLADSPFRKTEWDFQIDRRTGKERKLIRFSAGLESVEGHTAGSIDYSEKQNSETRGVRVTPVLEKEITGEYKGTLEITDYSGKIIKKSIRVGILYQPGESIIVPEKDSLTVVHPDSAEGKAAGEELSNRMYQMMIHGLMSIPEADLVFISDGLPDEIWKDLVQ